MWFTDYIFSIVWDISDFFLWLSIEARDIAFVGDILGDFLYAISRAFWNLLTPIAQLGDWLYEVDQKIRDVITFADIEQFALQIYDLLLPIADWIDNAWTLIYVTVDTWWQSTRLTVQGWIDSAIAGFLTMVNQVEASLGDLRTSWDNFWTLTWPDLVQDLGGLWSSWSNFLTGILPGLATWTGVGSLVESTLKSWFPFYDDLVALWGGIVEFFVNPLDWIVSRIESWFWEEG